MCCILTNAAGNYNLIREFPVFRRAGSPLLFCAVFACAAGAPFLCRKKWGKERQKGTPLLKPQITGAYGGCLQSVGAALSFWDCIKVAVL
jgi:hypothetical protein